MSEEQNKAASQNAEGQQQTAPASDVPQQPVHQPQITRAQLKEMRANRDLDSLSKIAEGKPLQPPSEKQVQPEQQGQEDQKKTEQKPTVQEKIFNVKYKNKTYFRPDPDHMLGLGNLPALKRRTIMLEEDVTEAANELAEARKYGESSASEIAKLKAALAEKEAALEKFNRQQQPQSNQPPVQASKIDLPQAPTFTPVDDIPDTDPINWTVEHAAKIKKAHQEQQAALKAQIEYNRKLAEAIDSLRANPPQQSMNTDQQRALSDMQSKLAQLEEQNRVAQQRLVETATWQQYSDFQSSHPDLRTKKPLREVHDSVNNWIDKLAATHGVKLPMGATPQQRAEYDAARRAIAGQWLNGDQEVKTKSEGIEPPDGYEQYFAVAKTIETRDRLIKDGKLGPNATLDDAFNLDLIENGALDEATSRMESDKLKEGVNAALTAIGKQASEYARPLPNNAGGEQPMSTARDEKTALLRLAGTSRGMREIYADPAKLKVWQEIQAEYEKTAQTT